MPRQTKPKRPNLIKLANTSAALLKATGGGWTWRTAVDDVAGNAGLTAAERAELHRMLELRGCPAPDPGEDDRPAHPDPGDEGPYYDRDKALDEPDDEIEGPDDVVGQIVGPDGVSTIDVPRWATTEPTHAGGDIGHDPVGEDPPEPRLPTGEELAAMAAAAERQAALQRIADDPPEDEPDTIGRPGPERRSTRELLAEAEDTARRLRVRLLNECARERAERSEPLPSEAMRSLEALHPLRKTLPPAAFDQLMTTLVHAIERDWGPIVT